MKKGLLILCLTLLCVGCRQSGPSDDPSGSFQLPLTSLYSLDERGITLEITVEHIFEHKYDGGIGSGEHLVMYCSVKQVFRQDTLTLAAGDPVWIGVELSECSQSEDDLRALLSEADSLVVNGMEQEEVYISVDSEDGRQWLSELGQNEIGTAECDGSELFLNLSPWVRIASHDLTYWSVLPIKDGHFYGQDMIAALKQSGHNMYFDVDRQHPPLRVYFQDGCTEEELYAGIQQMLESERPSFPPLP